MVRPEALAAGLAGLSCSSILARGRGRSGGFYKWTWWFLWLCSIRSILGTLREFSEELDFSLWIRAEKKYKFGWILKHSDFFFGSCAFGFWLFEYVWPFIFSSVFHGSPNWHPLKHQASLMGCVSYTQVCSNKLHNLFRCSYNSIVHHNTYWRKVLF